MKHKILLPMFLLCLTTAITPVMASDSLQVPITAEGDAGTELILSNSKNASESYDEVVGSNGKATFDLSYTEPGDYSYVLKDKDNSEKPINITVSVTNQNDTSDELEAAIIAKQDGSKLENISFKKQIKSTPKHTQTGVEADYLPISIAVVSASLLLLIIIVATMSKGHDKKKENVKK